MAAWLWELLIVKKERDRVGWDAPCRVVGTLGTLETTETELLQQKQLEKQRKQLATSDHHGRPRKEPGTAAQSHHLVRASFLEGFDIEDREVPRGATAREGSQRGPCSRGWTGPWSGFHRAHKCPANSSAMVPRSS